VPVYAWEDYRRGLWLLVAFATMALFASRYLVETHGRNVSLHPETS
jgi:hypothetical protein